MRVNTLFILLFLLFIGSCTLFLTYKANGNWDFVLPFRGKKLLLLIIIGYTIGVSTLLFQTLTHNPILTPSILGFDYLYLLTQTALVFFFGGIGFTQLDPSNKFLFETFMMLGGALLLFSTITRGNPDLSRMILVGVIFGVLFRNMNNLLQRLIDPNEFAIAQGSSFADFNTVKAELLTIATVIALLSVIWVWSQRHKLDVLLLGRDYAVGLGVDYPKFSQQLLICCAVLVSVSTALVGPILFLGLLVCAVVNTISPKVHHAIRIPMVFMVSGITLILGQVIFEQIMKMQGVLSVVIEFVGGIVFIYLVLRKKKK
ncbi:iron chelate uptake ABC transporter family permease subunit [Glaesserella sp.]|uniref:iron chelate uptake ABC transporter family permease subunit n=1 Tax=Glaesserella sp. TaxID=2094731 RepID=UPI0035A11324